MKRRLPAVDSPLASRAGLSRDGQPLSYNRAPAPDLAHWIGRVYATIIDAPDDHSLDCGLFDDSAVLRIQLRGQWSAQTRDGRLERGPCALFFGPHSRRMPVSVTGGFASVGAVIRPGVSRPRRVLAVKDYLDRIVSFDEIAGHGEDLHTLFDARAPVEDLALALEDWLRSEYPAAEEFVLDPLTRRFEAMAFADPSASVATIARSCDVDVRTLERIVLRDFGLTPKQVLRRARALDMASHLRGVADQAEADDLVLRYYDQSHLIRDFTELLGMPPRQFVRTPQPILTQALEARQARRLEMMERLAPGQARPWQ